MSAGACGGELPIVDGNGGSGGAGGACDASGLAYETGDPNGHADPYGAKAAGQARAGRLKAADVVQSAHGRQRVETGDFVLVNDKVAFVIEDKDISDGYGRFGGEIIAADRVGDDGRPLGLSYFLETLQLTSLDQINPTSVTVMNDGSDGAAAVVRVTGPLEPIPFLKETFGAALPPQYDGLTAAYDFVLEPGSEKLDVRFGFINTTDYPIDTGLNFNGSWNFWGFFQGSQNKLFMPGIGYAEPDGEASFAGFDNDSLPFAYTGPAGGPIAFAGISLSGFSVFNGEGQQVEPCSMSMIDDHSVVVGEPGRGIDGLGEAVRRATGEAPWREITGTVSDAAATPVAGAHVHVLSTTGSYLTRTTTDENGAFTVHAPEGAVTLVPQKRGYPVSEGIEVSGATADLGFEPNGFIHVVATEAVTNVAIPVRVQVIPTEPEPATPAAYGDDDEASGRLWQEFAITGDALLPVPVGNHRVLVTRGYEWELSDVTVDVAAGATVEMPVSLVHSVATTGALSADFHIHSMYSADSSDPVLKKVKSAIADGLEVPVSSEHEWIIEFQPYIEELGMTDWAFGPGGSELTTFTFGHFGLVGVEPLPDAVNNGAFDWLDKSAQDIFDGVHAKPESPALIVNHPQSDSTFQAYFKAVKFDRDTGSSDDELWSDHFDAVEVFNGSENGGNFTDNRDGPVADWFALLNHSDKKYWAVGSSDSHAVRSSPVGYPRSYMFLGYDTPATATREDVRDSILNGRITVGGGLFMNVVGPGGSTSGDSVPKTATADFTVNVACPSWVSAETLEVIVNGETVATEPLLPVGAGPGKAFSNQVTVTLPAGNRAWVVFHAKGSGDLAPLHPGKQPFAVSNPVFFEE
ncbi:MAG: CehA/McbA family metallohydrolase [Myxococcales bacterium]|nr:CehA/McbA family metallohydrolase [Myxococcales bacterium]